MTNRNDKDTPGRTVAIVGGGAFLLWLLMRGDGFGLGGGYGSDRSGSGDGAAPSAPSSPPAPCRVRIDAEGIELDGAPTDLDTMTDRCRAAGSAEVRATGAAIAGVIAEVVHALRAAGVTVWADPSVLSASTVTPTRRPR